jgi:hypothetical protein
MFTCRISADINDDHRVVLTLPPDAPTGKQELIVSIAPAPETAACSSRSSLADWSERSAEHWGNLLNATDVEGFTGRGT